MFHLSLATVNLHFVQVLKVSSLRSFDMQMLRNCGLINGLRPVSGLPVRLCIAALPNVPLSYAHALTGMAATTLNHAEEDPSVVDALAKYSEQPFDRSIVCSLAQKIRDRASTESADDFLIF